MNISCSVWRVRSASSAGAGSPCVAACSMTLAMNSPWVVRLSILALIRPRLSSLSTRAPPISTTSPKRFRTTISWPRREPGNRQRLGWRSAWASGFTVAIADAIKGLDRVELRVHLAELPAHAFDVAVDGAVVDIDLIVVGGVHQVVAAFDEARALRQGLQQKKLRDGQLDRLVVPQ